MITCHTCGKEFQEGDTISYYCRDCSDNANLLDAIGKMITETSVTSALQTLVIDTICNGGVNGRIYSLEHKDEDWNIEVWRSKGKSAARVLNEMREEMKRLKGRLNGLTGVDYGRNPTQ